MKRTVPLLAGVITVLVLSCAGALGGDQTTCASDDFEYRCEVDTGAFHMFRLFKLASGDGNPGHYPVYCDDRLIRDNLQGMYAGNPVTCNRFFFGDMGSWDSATRVDYVRWDSIGAYAPETQ